MKLNLSRETLLKPLQMVVGVIERKNAMPILTNVLLSINDNKLSVTGTDTEIELIGHTDFISEQPTTMQLTLPGRKLVDICRALPEDSMIDFLHENEKVILRSGKSRFSLATLPVADFPNMESKLGFLAFTIPQHQLKTLLQRTCFAIAQQDVRHYLNGLLLEMLPNQLRAIATDGHRLAYHATTAVINTEQKQQAIMPRKSVLELLRLLNDNEDEVGITLSKGHIHIAADNFIFASKLVESRFPDYERVIPRNGKKVIVTECEPLKQALHRAAILCNEKHRSVRVELQTHLLKISTNNPAQEYAEEEIVIDYNKEPLEIGFNVGYLLEALNIISGDLVKLTFTDAQTSVLIEEEQATANEKSLFVLMPMRM